jgi:hypothetical protein
MPLTSLAKSAMLAIAITIIAIGTWEIRLGTRE